MPRICVFDVNETLLDLHALDPQFARIAAVLLRLSQGQSDVAVLSLRTRS